MSDTRVPQRRLLVPFLGGFYAHSIDYAELLLRVFAGITLVTHGYPKIIEPFARVEMVEGLGFYPGVLFSPLLAITEFFGGMLIAIGLFTRPAALAAAFVLFVAAWFHWITLGQGFGGAEFALLWALVMVYFVIRGGNRFSVDAKLGREF